MRFNSFLKWKSCKGSPPQFLLPTIRANKLLNTHVTKRLQNVEPFNPRGVKTHQSLSNPGDSCPSEVCWGLGSRVECFPQAVCTQTGNADHSSHPTNNLSNYQHQFNIQQKPFPAERFTIRPILTLTPKYFWTIVQLSVPVGFQY